MKCEKCVFAKKIDGCIVKCCNPLSAKYEDILVDTVGGCAAGTTSTNGINKVQQERLMYMKYF